MTEKSILGIDLRVSAVKAVELKKGPRGWTILGWGMDQIPIELIDKHPDKEIVQANTLKKIISENHLKATEAFVVIGGPNVLVKRLALPLLSHEETTQAIKWKIKDEVGYPIEEAVIDFRPMGKSANPEETDYLIVAVRAETINRVIQVMANANIKLISVIPVPVALKEVYAESLPPDAFVALIYMGKRTTNISIYKGEQLHFNREIPIGGEDITKAMTSVLVSSEGRLELSYEQAESMKREFGIPLEVDSYPKVGDIPVTHLYSLMRPAMEKVENEISRTIEYFKVQEPDAEIQKIIISGGTSKTPHLIEFLSKSSGLRYEQENPISKLTIDDSVKEKEELAAAAAQLSCAVGAAMTSVASAGINMSPADLRDKWKIFIKKHTNPVEILAVFTFLLFIVYFIMAIIGLNLKTSINESQKTLAVLKPKLIKLEELEKAMKEEEGRRGVFQSIEIARIKIPAILQVISANLPDSVLIENITFVEIDKSVGIKGLIFSRGGAAENTLSRFISNLSNSAQFKKVDLVNAVKVSGYLYDAFNFEISGLVGK